MNVESLPLLMGVGKHELCSKDFSMNEFLAVYNMTLLSRFMTFMLCAHSYVLCI